MMGQKHLHELLREDQEPFQLKNFIADRRSQLQSAAGAGETALQPRKRKPVIGSASSASARSFCINHVCVFSFQDSPDVGNSPFPEFPSPAIKSPNNAATVFLHIPARTAAMLLDAAARIQKQSRPKRLSPKDDGVGLLGSFFKRLTGRSARTKRREIRSVKRSRKTEAVNDVVEGLEASCSSSPSSPFHFSLQKSSSPGRRTPDFPSPATSPSRHSQQENENDEVVKCEEEEEKEQCSPVSVLDPLFADDDDEEHDHYAGVQRAQQQLLQKLQRFERLAGLGTPTHMNGLVNDMVVEEEKAEGREEAVERNTIDMMVEGDLETEKMEGWRRYDEVRIREIGAEMEAAVFGGLVEDLARELVDFSGI